MAFVTDEQNVVVIRRVPFGLLVDLCHQRAGRVDRLELAGPGLLVDLRRHAVGGEHDDRALGHLVVLLDEDRALGLQRGDHVLVVDDLLAHVDRRAVERRAPPRRSAPRGRRRRSSRGAWPGALSCRSPTHRTGGSGHPRPARDRDHCTAWQPIDCRPCRRRTHPVGVIVRVLAGLGAVLLGFAGLLAAPLTVGAVTAQRRVLGRRDRRLGHPARRRRRPAAAALVRVGRRRGRRGRRHGGRTAGHRRGRVLPGPVLGTSRLPVGLASRPGLRPWLPTGEVFLRPGARAERRQPRIAARVGDVTDGIDWIYLLADLAFWAGVALTVIVLVRHVLVARRQQPQLPDDDRTLEAVTDGHEQHDRAEHGRATLAGPRGEPEDRLLHRPARLRLGGRPGRADHPAPGHDRGLPHPARHRRRHQPDRDGPPGCARRRCAEPRRGRPRRRAREAGVLRRPGARCRCGPTRSARSGSANCWPDWSG